MYDQFIAQQALQRQASQDSSDMYAPQMQEQIQQSQAVLVAETNPDKVVERIILRLEGVRKKLDGSFEKWGEPKLNKYGIDWARYILESCINQNIIMTHLDEKQIAKLIIQLGDSITDDLTLNWKHFGIKSKTDLDIIEDTILFNVYAALNRALGQNEKNWLGRVSIEHISPNAGFPKPKSEGFLSKFKL